MGQIEAGCLARILPPPTGHPGLNTGRIVRVLLPEEGDRLWLVAAIDGKPLRSHALDDNMQVIRPEHLLQRIEEGEDDGTN